MQWGSNMPALSIAKKGQALLIALLATIAIYVSAPFMPAAAATLAPLVIDTIRWLACIYIGGQAVIETAAANKGTATPSP